MFRQAIGLFCEQGLYPRAGFWCGGDSGLSAPASTRHQEFHHSGGLRQRLTDLLERKQALGTRSIEASATVEADLRKLELTIRRLQQTLASVVVAEIPADQEKVAFGATATVRHRNGAEAAYQIVGVEEAD